MKQLILVIVVTLIGTGAFFVPAQTTDMELERVIKQLHDPELRKSSPEELVAVIERAGNIALNNCCPEKDPQHADEMKFSPELLSALVDLLDFEKPKKKVDPATGSALTGFNIASNMTIYPAIYAIEQFKKAALPAMVEIIENEDEKSVRAKNAFVVIRRIHEFDDVEVSNFLLMRSSAAKSEESKKRLLSASTQALAEKKKLEDARLRDSQGTAPFSAGEVRKVDIEPKATP